MPHTSRHTRLVSLTAAAALTTGVLAASVPAANAASQGRNTYSSWDGAALAKGAGSGTTVSNGAVRIAKPGALSAAWTSPWSAPGFGFRQLITSWRATTPAHTWLEVQVRGRATDGRVSSYDTVARWSTRDDGFQRTSSSSQTDDLGWMNVDTFVASSGVRFGAWQARVVLHRAAGAASPSLRGLGAVSSVLPSGTPATSTPLGVARRLDVPAYSQMIHRGEYPKYGGGGEAWCSPTSTSMLLGYYHALPSATNYSWVNRSYTDRWVDHVARMVYDYGYQGAGNWPFNTAYAAQYTPDAFVSRLSSLRQAERFIAVGIPLGASIAFGSGQLSGAPISASDGHLVVISGFTRSGDVVVNDPAAPSNRSVVRVYDRGQFERAWLAGSGGTVYVVHDKAHPLPPGAPGAPW